MTSRARAAGGVGTAPRRVIVATRNTSRVPEFGGSFWVRLQYLLGLRDLGLDAYWIDRLDLPDPGRDAHSIEYMVRRFAASLDASGQ